MCASQGALRDGAEAAKPDDAKILIGRMEHQVGGQRLGSGNNLRADTLVYVTVQADSDMADEILRQRFLSLIGKQTERKFNEIAWSKVRFADSIPQRAPQQGPLENIGDSAQPLDDGLAAALIQQKAAVGVIVIVQEDILGTGLGNDFLQLGPFRVQHRVDTGWSAVSIFEQDLHADRPNAAFAENIVLRQ